MRQATSQHKQQPYQKTIITAIYQEFLEICLNLTFSSEHLLQKVCEHGNVLQQWVMTIGVDYVLLPEKIMEMEIKVFKIAIDVVRKQNRKPQN